MPDPPSRIPKEKYTKPYPLLSLNSWIGANKIWMNPFYQRESVWSKSQKQALIDSILIDIDIPKLYFHRTQEKGYEYEVVDGQQRLRAMAEFFADQFELPDYTKDVDGYPVAGLKYSQLPLEVQNKLQTAQYDIVFLNSAYDQEDIEEMFTRLQNGTPLNAAEKRRAYPGNMKHVVSKLSKHRVFEFCSFSERRYGYEDAVAKVLHMIIHGQITDIRPASIRQTYEHNQKIDEKDPRVKDLSRTLNFLSEAFKGLPDPKLKKWALITLSYLSNGLLESYSLSNFPSEFGRMFLNFEQSRLENVQRPEEKQDPELLAFTNSVRSDSIPDMEFRDRQLKIRTFLAIPDLEPLDPKRGFSPEARLAVFWRDKGRCQNCGKQVDQSDFHVDHIKPHSSGGKTILRNARLLCPECNLKKGNKPEVQK